jgi:hypothetical protein
MIANLALHDMHIFPAGTPDRIEPGTVAPTHIIPPSPWHQPVRLGHRVTAAATLDVGGICVDDVAFGADTGQAVWLPEPGEGVWYLVSLPVGLAASHRSDLLVVHEPVRDHHGHALGCRKLARPVRTQPVSVGAGRPMLAAATGR